MKKSLILILILTILPSAASAAAINDGFDGYSDEYPLTNAWSIAGVDADNTVKLVGDTLVLTAKNKGNPGAYQVFPKRAGSLVVQTDLTVKANTGGISISLASADSNFTRLLTFFSDGSLQAANGVKMQAVANYNLNTPYSVAAILDTDSYNYSVVLNGQTIAGGLQLPLIDKYGDDASWNSKGLRGYMIDTYNLYEADTTAVIDGVKLYYGYEIMSPEDIESEQDEVLADLDGDASESVSLIYYDDFEARAIDSSPEELTVWEKESKIRIANYYDNKVIKINRLESDPYIIKSFSPPPDTGTVFDFSINFADLPPARVDFMVQGSGGWITFMRADTDGYLRSSTNVALTKISLRTWFDISLCFKLPQGAVDIYVNGDKKVSNILLSGLTAISNLRWYNVGYSGDATYYLDDFFAYYGSEPQDHGELIEQSKNLPDKQKILERQIASKMGAGIAVAPMVDKVYVSGRKEELGGVPFAENGTLYIPLRATAKRIGATVDWVDEKAVVTFRNKESTVDFANNYNIKGKASAYDWEVKESGGSMYIPYQVFADMTGKSVNYYLDRLLVISDGGGAFDVLADASKIVEIANFLTYERPSKETYLADFYNKHKDGAHPSILIDSNDIWDNLIEQSKTNNYIAECIEATKHSADAFLSIPVTPFSRDSVGRTPVHNSWQSILASIAAYKWSGGERRDYLDRVLSEVDQFCKVYPDWGQNTHFLDPAVAGFTMAAVYDWLYDDLSDDYKKLIKEKLIERAILPGINAYKGSAQGWWVESQINWNTVCNSGLLCTAVALIDDEPELASQIISGALKSIEFVLPEFAPDGAWNEGPGYWEYNASYYAKLLATLDSAFGNDYGYFTAAGMDKTGYFPIYADGTQGVFGIHDITGSPHITSPTIFYFAKKNNDGDLMAIALQRNIDLKVAGGVEDLLYQDFSILNMEADKLSLDYTARGLDIATFRSAWNDGEALWAGIHAGDNAYNHGHLDAGEFALDALGERWALTLGKDHDTLAGYYNAGSNGQRWTYYRNRAEGHNTVITNPTDAIDQQYNASATFDGFVSKPKGAFAAVDMSGVLFGVDGAKRGIYFDRENNTVTLQDEIQGSGYEFYWFMHTRASIDISKDGRTATLKLKDKTMTAELQSDAAAQFSVMAAKPLVGMPDPAGQDPNYGINKLTIHIPKAKTMTISVKFTPVTDGYAAKETGITTIKNWSVPDGELLKLPLDGLEINGETPEYFSPNKKSYLVQLPFGTTDIPQISASSQYPVNIRQASELPGSAKVYVTNAEGGKVDYTVSFTILPKIGIDGTIPKIKTSVYAFSEEQDSEGNYAVNAIDADPVSRWSAEGSGQWLALDLGAKQTLTGIGLAFHNGSTRSYYYEIQISDDGEAWEAILTGESSGTTDDEEITALPAVSARYIKYVGLTNSENAWNNVKNFTVYGQ
jgi:hypothetical protein